jgi:hypothetical protein
LKNKSSKRERSPDSMIHTIETENRLTPEVVYKLTVSRQFIEDLVEVLCRDMTIPDALEAAYEEEAKNAFTRLIIERKKLAKVLGLPHV